MLLWTCISTMWIEIGIRDVKASVGFQLPDCYQLVHPNVDMEHSYRVVQIVFRQSILLNSG